MEEQEWYSEGYPYRYLKKSWVLQATNSVYLPIAKSANTTMKSLLSTNKPSDDFLAELKHSERYQRSKRTFPGDMNFDDDDMLIHFYTPYGVTYLRDCEFTLGDLASGARRTVSL